MNPFSHLLAGFSFGFRYRHELSGILKNSPETATVLDLDLLKLRSSGIMAVVLDFDGVLANHGALAPLPEVAAWLKHCETLFGGEHIFILSNRPTKERQRWFTEHFPAVRFIGSVRKKPYPDGIIKACELAAVPTDAILMADDRLLTGCLAALIAGASPCYIRRPFVSMRENPAAELFFISLRLLERLLIRTLVRLPLFVKPSIPGEKQ